jgi:3-hydroxyacyl-[acyl-carrier-protein] dehydratase
MSSQREEFAVDIVIPANHPSFEGHFPMRPLVPGVVLLSEILVAAGAIEPLRTALGRAPTIEVAKFLNPVGPASHLRLSMRLLDDKRPGVAPVVEFKITCAETVVAKGRLSPTAAGVDEAAP